MPARSDTLFTDHAVTVGHQSSRGLPRAVRKPGALQSLIAPVAVDRGIPDQAAAKMAVVEVAGD